MRATRDEPHLAGTRPRGKTIAEDLALEEELRNDPKELAEHLMLLDLGRNDVGRVSKIGSVRVTEKMIVERFSHVMHITSNVVGQVREDVDALHVRLSGAELVAEDGEAGRFSHPASRPRGAPGDETPEYKRAPQTATTHAHASVYETTVASW